MSLMIILDTFFYFGAFYTRVWKDNLPTMLLCYRPQRSCGKLMFYTCLSVHIGGVSGRVCRKIPLSGRQTHPGDGHCNGRYASYWNAFLFSFLFWCKRFVAVHSPPYQTNVKNWQCVSFFLSTHISDYEEVSKLEIENEVANGTQYYNSSQNLIH